MVVSVEIEKALYEILRETDLLAFKMKLAVEKQLTRIDHFLDVTDDELLSYGLSTPAVRRLRSAIERWQKQPPKSKKSGHRRERLVTITANDSDLVADEASSSTSSTGANGETTACIISRDEVRLMENIGEGTFAVVKRAVWQRPGGAKTECAVKILRDMSEHVRADLFAEIANMRKLHHQNLVRLHGVVFGEPILMVLEFCDNGSLLDRLRNRKKERLLVTRLHNYAQQIADGMSYLESRRFVHRDLATRNVLLADNEEVVKICDFGLTRAINENERLYVMNGQKKVPFSWCPPESLRFRQFSHKSDVWAFGVTLWELYTCGEEPWIGYKAVDVLQAIEAGERLRQPKFCSRELYDIMQMCWRLKAEERPTFSHLRMMLQNIKFTLAVCRNGYIPPASSDGALSLQADERVIIISERNESTCFGQSLVTRQFGVFPRAFVMLCAPRQVPELRNDATSRVDLDAYNQRVKKPLSLMMNGGVRLNSETAKASVGSGSGIMVRHRCEISSPIPGSFIHTGHGDTDERKCWGYVEKIDDIYLKNAILSGSVGSSVGPIESVATGAGSVSDLSSTVNELSIGGPANGSILSALAGTSAPHYQRAVSVGAADGLFDFDFLASSGGDQILSLFTGSSSKLEQSKSATGGSDLPNSTTSFKSSSIGLLQMPPTKVATPRSAKYDSSISIPRPNRAPLLSVNSMTLSVTSPLTSFESAIMSSKLSTSSLPSAVVATVVPKTAFQSNNADGFADLFDLYKAKSTTNATTSVATVPVGSLPVSVEKTLEKDPFVVGDHVKSLLEKPTLSALLASSGSSTSSQKSAAFVFPSPPSTCRLSTKANNTAAAIDPAPLTLEATTANNAAQSNNVISAKITEGVPIASQALPIFSAFVPSKIYDKAVVPESLLPPPSELLLSGSAVENSGGVPLPPLRIDDGLAGGDSFLAGNSVLSFQPRFNSTFVHEPSRTYNWSLLGQYPRIFDIEDSDRRIRYGANGIPILEPTPVIFEPKAKPIANDDGLTQNGAIGPPPAPLIDLQDLNTDLMIENVSKSADFASREQCRAALLRNGFDVDAAVRSLKIEKLLEMGLAGDRHLAASALDACRWNVNEAENSLLSA